MEISEKALDLCEIPIFIEDHTEGFGECSRCIAITKAIDDAVKAREDQFLKDHQCLGGRGGTTCEVCALLPDAVERFAQSLREEE